MLVQRNHIGVALYDQRLASGCYLLLRTIQRKQVPRLVKDGRLFGIEIFGLRIPQHATAKANRVALLVVYGKHDAFKESVLHAP